MTSRIRRQTAVLTLAIAALVALPAGAAHADVYAYPCDGVVIQTDAGGHSTGYWYDSSGNWGQLPDMTIAWAVACYY